MSPLFSFPTLEARKKRHIKYTISGTRALEPVGFRNLCNALKPVKSTVHRQRGEFATAVVENRHMSAKAAPQKQNTAAAKSLVIPVVIVISGCLFWHVFE
ncbi:hypothetical protein CGGC5_v011211 [Colletotrichum fructicola Nara gc5]|uniref:Uncharacterized protein n=1 Tax=Colletotrichum fructicola (strain Nara gc5) TaxID=1213859 RepID=A0A7J6IWS2_COLFN|nr:hypothetical protein CGGC5_v011211 [Colletotrichum fructicola Nara gc5]